MNKELILLFDSLRDTRDMAEIIHLGLALDLKIELTGSFIEPSNYKVIKIIDSWLPGFKEKPLMPHVKTFPDFFARIRQLKAKGWEIIGTSSNSKNSLFSSNLSKGKQVIVFGTETSGLSKSKLALMDSVLSIPMKNNTKFFTIRTAAPIFAFDALRQKNQLK